MKKIIFILLMFGYLFAKAQDFEAPALKFNYMGKTNVPIDPNDFKETSFILGWEWGLKGVQFSQLMLTNAGQQRSLPVRFFQ